MARGRSAGRATGYFPFKLPVEPTSPMVLAVSYNRAERYRRAFEILVDGVKIADQTMDGRSPQERSEFFDVRYAVPDALVAGKQSVTVRFQGAGGSEVACRLRHPHAARQQIAKRESGFGAVSVARRAQRAIER